MNHSPFFHESIDATQTPWSGQADEQNNLDVVDEAATDALIINTRCACTHVLEWPVFGGRIDSSCINSTASNTAENISDVRTQSKQQIGHSSRPSGGVDESDAVTLVRNFLKYVHIKNPVLDRTTLLGMARTVAEEGFTWDATSCLVLLACALGSLATAWKMALPCANESSLDDVHSYPTAEAYYTAGRKRLGLVEGSVQATLCWFLNGIYEMYSMRPLRAWSSFNRACTFIELQLCVQSCSGPEGSVHSNQRLYWSCLKSETELREEFELPPPGLARMEHPDVLPTPPESTPVPGEGNYPEESAWQEVHQQSWYYYLSDIAYRRISNRTITALYNKPKEAWLSTPIQQLLTIAEELDAQVTQWWSHIPNSPNPAFQADTDELTYMLYLDYADVRERIWRPFLYIAVHGELSKAADLDVQAAAIRCLDVSFGMLENARLKHRHHGCWQTIRCTLTKALLVLAAVKCARLNIRSDWRRYIEDFQLYLRYWQDEAPDLGAADRALSTLLDETE